MAEERAARTLYTFGPRPTRGVMLGLGVTQLVGLGAGGVLALAILATSGNLLAALVPLALAGVYVWAPVSGRPVHEWAGPAAAHCWRLARGDVTWSASPETPGPVPFAGLEVVSAGDPEHPVAVVVNTGRGRATYTAVMAVSGGDFAMINGADQERRLAAWGEALSGLGAPGLGISRVQWVERSGPERADAAASWAARHRTVAASSPAAQSYAGLLSKARPEARRHDVWLAIQVSPRRCDPALGSSDPGLEEVLAAVDLAARRINSAELTTPGAVGPGELGEVLHALIDPDYARALASNPRHLRSVGSPLPWPAATETPWGAFRTDGTWHATYWLSELPRRPVGAAWLSPLLLSAVAGVRSLSVVMEPLSPAKAARRAEREVFENDADAAQRDRLGFARTARRERERAQAATREEELVSGYSLMRFVGLVSVAARDRKALAEACREVEQAAGQACVELVRLYGRQDLAFVASLPLCAGLARMPWGM